MQDRDHGDFGLDGARDVLSRCALRMLPRFPDGMPRQLAQNKFGCVYLQCRLDVTAGAAIWGRRSGVFTTPLCLAHVQAPRRRISL